MKTVILTVHKQIYGEHVSMLGKRAGQVLEVYIPLTHFIIRGHLYNTRFDNLCKILLGANMWG